MLSTWAYSQNTQPSPRYLDEDRISEQRPLLLFRPIYQTLSSNFFDQTDRTPRSKPSSTPSQSHESLHRPYKLDNPKSIILKFDKDAFNSIKEDRKGSKSCEAYKISLDKSADTLEPAAIVQLALNLTRYSSLKSLDLELKSSLKENVVRSLAQAIVLLPGLENLRIDGEHSFHLSDPQVEILINSSLQHNTLKALEINGLIHSVKREGSALKLWYGKPPVRYSDEIGLLANRLKCFADCEEASFDLPTIKINYGGKFSYFCKQLKKYTNLRKLTLNLKKSEWEGEEDFDVLSLVFASLKNLTELDLDVSESASVDSVMIETLLNSIRDHFLRKVILNFKGCKFEDTALKMLANIIKFDQSIALFDLNMEDNQMITDAGMIALSEGLNNNITLNKIRLNFAKCRQLTHKSASHMAATIQRKFFLRELVCKMGDLSLSWFDHKQHSKFILNPTTFKEEDLLIIEAICSNFKFLESFSLIYRRCEDLSTINIKKFTKAIKALTSLETFHLELNSCTKLTDDDVSQISDLLKHLPSLTQLVLMFNYSSQVSDKSLVSLSKQIKKLAYLTDLRLSFLESPTISHKGLAEISKPLQTFTKMQNIHFDFHWCNMINDQGVQEIAKAISKMTQLKSLTVNFGVDMMHQSLITNKSLTYILECFMAFENLEKLKFAFSWADGLDDYSMTELAMALTFLKKLKYFKLALYGCPKVSSKGLTTFSRVLKSMPLEELFLAFGNSELIDKLGVYELINQVKLIKTLRNLGIDFANCSHVNSSVKERLEKTIAQILERRNLRINNNENA